VTFHDPRVEFAWRVGDREVLLVISDVETADSGPEAPHLPRVYRLQR
jgi:hypothetical protein